MPAINQGRFFIKTTDTPRKTKPETEKTKRTHTQTRKKQPVFKGKNKKSYFLGIFSGFFPESNEPKKNFSPLCTTPHYATPHQNATDTTERNPDQKQANRRCR